MPHKVLDKIVIQIGAHQVRSRWKVRMYGISVSKATRTRGSGFYVLRWPNDMLSVAECIFDDVQ